MKTYGARWGRALRLISLLGSVVCVGSGFAIVWSSRGIMTWAGWLPLALIGGCALFTIRGYTIGRDALLVRRLWWTTRLPLAELQSATFEPSAMDSSVRLFGNGGLFSFSGLYRNNRLGSYRAFVTDLKRTVVLRFVSRTIVVSPDAPGNFVQEITSRESRSRLRAK